MSCSRAAIALDDSDECDAGRRIAEAVRGTACTGTMCFGDVYARIRNSAARHGGTATETTAALHDEKQTQLNLEPHAVLESLAAVI